MLKKLSFYLKITGVFVFLQVLTFSVSGQSYLNVNEINQKLNKFKKENSDKIKIHSLGKSIGGFDVNFIEIGLETNTENKKLPAVFVLANPDGNNPLSSYMAINFIEKVISEEHYKSNTYYVLPVLNSDGLSHYFKDVRYNNVRNFLAVNDDNDELTDEDDFDDLNKDGFITKMRVVHPEGTWIIDPNEPRLMKKANKTKGEKGIYKVYSEGLDNDGDGKYNEDPVGGVNLGINFPFFHKPENKSAGQWPGSEEVVFNLMKFVFEHPEIAMSFTFGETNNCLNAPKPVRKGSADFDKIKIPKRFAENFNIDVSRTYSMDEIIELFQPMVPQGMTLTPNMVASFLGLGAIVNHVDEDVALYSEFADKYKEYLKDTNYNIERLNASNAKDGSFELWMYFHVGLPSFSMNFFTIPKPKKEETKESEELTLDKLEKLTPDEFVALGEEKIAAFFKTNNVPQQYSAAQVIQMVEGGQITPERIVGMIKSTSGGSSDKKDDGKSDETEIAKLEYSDKVLSSKGFVNWQKYQHPTLGEVEIGGFTPYMSTTPILDSLGNEADIQMNWVFELVKKAPRIVIADVKTKNLGSGIYKVEVWIENTAGIPFHIEMGVKNEQPAPAILILQNKDIKLLEGKIRTPIEQVKALSTYKVEYLIKAKSGINLDLKLESKNAGNDQKQFKIK